MKKALIIGSSSGIGLSTALAFKEAGFSVYGAARGTSAHDFPQLTCDVRYPDTIKQVLDEVGTIDVLVYSAGIGLASPAEETTREDYLELFDVNFFGLCECVKLALPKMNSGGRIIAISSLAGVNNVPYSTFYCASKAAVNSYIAGLNMELKGRGIAAISVMPAGTQTTFTYKRKKYCSARFKTSFDCSCQNLAKEEQEGATANSVALSVLNAALMDNPPILLPLTVKGKAGFALEHILPKKLSNLLSENKFMQ